LHPDARPLRARRERRAVPTRELDLYSAQPAVPCGRFLVRLLGGHHRRDRELADQPRDPRPSAAERGVIRRNSMQPLDRRDNALAGLNIAWWVYLVSAFAWFVIAWVVLRFDVRTVAAVAVLAGIVIVMAGLAEMFNA